MLTTPSCNTIKQYDCTHCYSEGVWWVKHVMFCTLKYLKNQTYCWESSIKQLLMSAETWNRVFIKLRFMFSQTLRWAGASCARQENASCRCIQGHSEIWDLQVACGKSTRLMDLEDRNRLCGEKQREILIFSQRVAVDQSQISEVSENPKQRSINQMLW